jgi:hypothetical protein
VELGREDAVAGSNSVAAVISLDKVEAVAVSDHAWLDRLWYGDAVGCGRGRSTGGHGERSGGESDDSDTHIDTGPDIDAAGADKRVPIMELRQTGAGARRNGVAAVAGPHEVKTVTVGHHAGLDGLGSLHRDYDCRARGSLSLCSRGDCRGRGDGRNIGLVPGLDAVRPTRL